MDKDEFFDWYNHADRWHLRKRVEVKAHLAFTGSNFYRGWTYYTVTQSAVFGMPDGGVTSVFLTMQDAADFVHTCEMWT